jgi:hypothetical protein
MKPELPTAFTSEHTYCTGWTIGVLGFDSRQELGIFLFTTGTHPASYPVGTGGSFPGVKRSGRKADHSSPSSAEVKYAWSSTSTP